MLRESSVDGNEDIVNVQHSSPLMDNDDLKELCLLLDEERYKMHQIAEQWKQFGTSTIQKLECQIIDYEEKLNDLEQGQFLLIKENESLKSLVDQMMKTTINNDKQLTYTNKKQNISTQTYLEMQESPINDPLQQQISLQNIFDAIKTAEVYECIENMIEDDASEKLILKDFCNLVWKYLQDSSKPKSSCLL